MAYWAKTYGPGEANAVAVDKNGDIIVAGYVEKDDKKDGFVARLDSEGNVKWFKTYGGDREDVFNDVKIAENGDIIVTGYTESFGAGKKDAWVLRLNANGNIKWQKTYGGKSIDEANAVAIADNGDIIIAGNTFSFGTVIEDIWVLRLDSEGNVKWAKTYGGESTDHAHAVAIADNGDIIVAGDTDSFGDSRDVWVLRLDSNGNVKWQKTYGGSGWDGYWDVNVAIAPNGDIIVAGDTDSFGAGGRDFWILRLDANGNVKWQKTYGGSGWDVAYAVAIADNGDIIVAGKTYSFGAGYGDAWVLRLDENGNVKWQKIYGGGNSKAVILTENGDIIVVGGYYGNNIWVLHLPQNGELKDFSIDSNIEASESNAIFMETHAQVSEVCEEKEVEEEHETWETVGRIIKRKVKKRVKVRRKIKEPIKGEPSSAEVRRITVREGVIYSTNPKITEFWRLISEGQLEKATELFETLYPVMSGALVTFLVPEPVLILEKEHEDEGTTEVLLGLSNPYLSRLRVKLNLKKDKYFTPERDSLTFTLKRGESFSHRVRVTRAKNDKGEYKLKWDYFRTTFEFPDHGARLDYWLKLVDEGGMAYALARLETNLAKRLELLRKAVSLGHEGAKKKLEEIERQFRPLKQKLWNSLSFTIPQLVEGVDSIIKLTAKNDFTNSLKPTLDLSDNDFLDLEATTLEFPELKKGQKVSKSLAVKPKYAGNFDFKVKIKAIADGIELETEKVIPVEVAERSAQAYATPVTPATPTPQPITPTSSSAGLQLPADFLSQLAYKYSDVELIGKGGFARVYRAKRKDGKIVAVKIPLSLDENTGKAFLREITNWLHLRHPNIVRLYDANILPIPFLEMEYCESSLAKLRKPLPVEVAAYLIFNIAEGLKYAHSKGIIHRDLKPSNILLKGFTPKISDWGLSKAMTETHSTTLASFTPFYASPEQTSRRFEKPDHRSDIWQLGVIFYELVTGRLPFEGDDLIEVVSRIATDEPVPPGELNPEAKEV
ncbi:protein kinase domain-containing protein, partial [Thermococcus sp.]